MASSAPALRLVVIESPYAGDVERNVRYARAAMADSLARGEAPIASHLLYTQPGILRDSEVEEREFGIRAGLAWGARAELVAFYVDFGWSDGMRAALAHWKDRRLAIEKRQLYTGEAP